MKIVDQRKDPFRRRLDAGERCTRNVLGLVAARMSTARWQSPDDGDDGNDLKHVWLRIGRCR
jgi:hypothetical protein